MIISFVLFSQLISQPLAQVDTAPGSAHAIPAKGVALHSDAGQDFPEVIALDGQTVVRIGEMKGMYREVYVPQGFAVYMHRDYLQLDEPEGTATVVGDRVNMRLLPSTDGLPTVGQLRRGTGPLVVLEQAGEWVRVLAPVQVPLFALDTEVPATNDATAAERWRALTATRETRRQAAIEAFRRADPAWQRETEVMAKVEALSQVDATKLAPAALAERRAQLDSLAGEAQSTQTQAAIESLRRELDSVHALRATAGSATEKVEQAETGPDAMSRRESRLLQLGFRYRGKGMPIQEEGVVQASGLAAAPVYTLRTSNGEVLKLTAAADIAKLPDLVGKRVQVDGRRLFLALIDGPVLVIDRVTLPDAR